MHIPDITRLSPLRSISISAENRDGSRGGGGRATSGSHTQAARELGVGWKMSPCIMLEPGSVTNIAEIDGPGVIQHIWMAVQPEWFRRLVLRFTWDSSDQPSIVVPVGDFFCQGWPQFAPVSSRWIATGTQNGLNSYWPMPFAEGARVTIENTWHEAVPLFYYLDIGVGELPEGQTRLHARWRRSSPVQDGIHELLDVTGDGQYVGTYLAFDSLFPGWWGEGEFKFFIDGDDEFPTICGTGTEDYFGGAWDFMAPGRGYGTYTTPYLGMHQAVSPDGAYQSGQRFGMYRWHELDPVRFRERLRVTVQDLGWRPNGSWRVRQDDIATTSLWYAAEAGDAGSDEPTLAVMETQAG